MKQHQSLGYFFPIVNIFAYICNHYGNENKHNLKGFGDKVTPTTNPMLISVSPIKSICKVYLKPIQAPPSPLLPPSPSHCHLTPGPWQ